MKYQIIAFALLLSGCTAKESTNPTQEVEDNNQTDIQIESPEYQILNLDDKVKRTEQLLEYLQNNNPARCDMFGYIDSDLFQKKAEVEWIYDQSWCYNALTQGWGSLVEILPERQVEYAEKYGVGDIPNLIDELYCEIDYSKPDAYKEVNQHLSPKKENCRFYLSKNELQNILDKYADNYPTDTLYRMIIKVQPKNIGDGSPLLVDQKIYDRLLPLGAEMHYKLKK